MHVRMQSLKGSFFIGIEMVAERFKAYPANDGLAVNVYRKLNRLKRFIGSEMHGSTRFFKLNSMAPCPAPRTFATKLATCSMQAVADSYKNESKK